MNTILDTKNKEIERLTEMNYMRSILLGNMKMEIIKLKSLIDTSKIQKRNHEQNR